MRNYNRLTHILNRNILKNEDKFSFFEIKRCFSKNDYNNLTPKEKLLVDKFFKEIEDDEDTQSIISSYSLNETNIENIFLTSPYAHLRGCVFWNDKYNLITQDFEDLSFHRTINDFESDGFKQLYLKKIASK